MIIIEMYANSILKMTKLCLKSRESHTVLEPNNLQNILASTLLDDTSNKSEGFILEYNKNFNPSNALISNQWRDILQKSL